MSLVSPLGSLLSEAIGQEAKDYRERNNKPYNSVVDYKEINVLPLFSLFLCYYLTDDTKLRLVDNINHLLALISDEMLSLFDLQKMEGSAHRASYYNPYVYSGFIVRRLSNRNIQRNHSLIKLKLKDIKDIIKLNDRYDEKDHELILDQIDVFDNLIDGYLACKKEYRANMYIITDASCLAKLKDPYNKEQVLVSERDKYTLERFAESFYLVSLPLTPIKHLYRGIEAHYKKNFITLSDGVVKLSRKIEDVKSKSDLLATFPIKEVEESIKELKEKENET